MKLVYSNKFGSHLSAKILIDSLNYSSDMLNVPIKITTVQKHDPKPRNRYRYTNPSVTADFMCPNMQVHVEAVPVSVRTCEELSLASPLYQGLRVYRSTDRPFIEQDKRTMALGKDVFRLIKEYLSP